MMMMVLVVGSIWLAVSRRLGICRCGFLLHKCQCQRWHKAICSTNCCRLHACVSSPRQHSTAEPSILRSSGNDLNVLTTKAVPSMIHSWSQIHKRCHKTYPNVCLMIIVWHKLCRCNMIIWHIPLQCAQNVIGWTVGFDVTTSRYIQLRISTWYFMLIMLFFYRLTAPPIVVRHLRGDHNILSENRSSEYLWISDFVIQWYMSYDR